MSTKRAAYSLFFLIAISLLLDSPASSQNAAAPPFISPQYKTPLSPQQLEGGYWRVDHTFQSNLRLTNSSLSEPINAVPVLYMADGTEYALPPLTVPSRGAAIVNINQALSNIPERLVPHLSSFGSISVQYLAKCPTNLNTSIENIDVPRSLVYESMFAPSSDAMPQKSRIGGSASGKLAHTIEGLWWKQFNQVQGTIAFINTSSSVIALNATMSGARSHNVTQWKVAPRSSLLLSLRELAGSDLESQQEGGITITYTAPERSILVLGMLEDEGKGYSAKMAFTYPSEHPHGSEKSLRYASAGIMVGAQPMMGFPAGTNFHGYLLLRNTSNKPLAIQPKLYLMGDMMAGSREIPGILLAANEVRRLDVSQLLKDN